MPDNPLYLAWSKHDFGQKLWQETAPQLASISEEYTTLDLSDNFLGNIAGTGLGDLCEAIPRTLEHLILRDNNLAFFASQRPALALDLARLPKLSSLNLGTNGLYRLSGEQLKNLLGCFYSGLSQLDLSDNNLHHMHETDLGIGLSGLHKDIHSISLARNHFDFMEKKHLAFAIKNCPHSLLSMDLSNNDLTSDDIKNLLPAFQSSGIRSVNLSGNPVSDSVKADLQAILDTVRSKDSKSTPTKRFHLWGSKGRSSDLMEIAPLEKGPHSYL